MTVPEAFRIPIRVSCAAASRHRFHPIASGLPFPRGLLSDPGSVGLLDASGREVPCDARALARWPDGSVKWLLARFQAAGDFGPADAASPPAYYLTPRGGDLAPRDGAAEAKAPSLRVTPRDGALEIDTGAAVFTLDTAAFRPFRSVTVSGREALAPETAAPVLVDSRGRKHRFRILTCEIENPGPAAVDVLLRGRMEPEGGGAAFCEAYCRAAFFAGSALARLSFTLWNPRAARHPGGLWDLGDPGSIRFRSFRLPFHPAPADGASILSLEPLGAEALPLPGVAELLQESSGGEAWDCLAHVDSDNQVTPRFRGWRLKADGVLREGLRAVPAVLHPGPAGSPALAMAMEGFWQTFPKGLAAAPGLLEARPFPDLEGREHELQGGERAAFTLWLDFAADPHRPGEALLPARLPLAAIPDPAWFASSGCLSPAAPGANALPGETAGPEAAYFRSLADGALAGPHSFFQRRETYDEYGWRNFGEVAADHEAKHYRGSRPLVSHYNNQYDLVLAFLTEFLRTGRPGWFELGRDLARHVMHVDIYHTQRDRAAYNGGYFWHTAHYLHAGTATHRTYSRLADDWKKPPRHYGGGPSNEHNYATGLALYHFLTGDPDAGDAVAGLARWVRDMQDGSLTPLRFLSRNETGKATTTRHADYQGPGRGGGYSINTSLDAFAVTGDRTWLAQAERFIRTCIHPGDDPDALDLLNREDRWSYVVFLQSLGGYLEVKLGLGERDDAFEYARTCLLAYARWMADKEYPYLDRPDQLEFPTSTWAAQDLRKTCVFLLAARFGPEAEAARFGERAAHFHRRACEQLRAADDADSARNLVLVMNHAPMYALHLREGKGWNLGLGEPLPPGWAKRNLIPQKIDARRRLQALVLTVGTAGLWRFLRRNPGKPAKPRA